MIRIAGLGTIALFLVAVRAMGAAQTKRLAEGSPELVLKNLAATLQLRIVRGDPEVHLTHPGASPIWSLLLGMVYFRRDVALEGAAGPFPMRFHLASIDRWVKLRFSRLFEHHEYDCALVVEGLGAPIEAEAWLESATPSLNAAPRLGLPVQQRLPSAHGTFVVAARDPSTAASLVAHLGAFAALPYVHLVATPGSVAFRFTEVGLAVDGAKLGTIRDVLLSLANAAGAQARAA